MASTGPVDDLSRQVIHGLVGNSDPKATSTGLLQEAQSWLTSTNSSLSGTVQARATAKLKTSIPLFSRLELKEVQLQVDLWADFVANTRFEGEITAKAAFDDDVAFSATGKLTRLSSGSTVLVLNLSAEAGALSLKQLFSWFAAGLDGVANGAADVTTRLGGVLTDQLDPANSKTAAVTSIRLRLEKPVGETPKPGQPTPPEPTFALLSLDFYLGSETLSWPALANVEIRSGTLQVQWTRLAASTPWALRVLLAGETRLGGYPLFARGAFDLQAADGSRMATLQLSSGAFFSLNAKEIAESFPTLKGGAVVNFADVNKRLTLPVDLAELQMRLEERGSKASAELIMVQGPKDTLWGLEDLRVGVNAANLRWPAAFGITLDAFRFQLEFKRKIYELACKFLLDDSYEFTCRLWSDGGKDVRVLGRLLEGTRCSVATLACYDTFCGDLEPINLVKFSEDNKYVEAGSDLGLSSFVAGTKSANVLFFAVCDDKQVIQRLRLQAAYDLSFDLIKPDPANPGPSIVLTNVGVCFDAVDPTGDNRTVNGYAFGRFSLDASTELFGMVAMNSKPSASEYWASMTIRRGNPSISALLATPTFGAFTPQVPSTVPESLKPAVSFDDTLLSPAELPTALVEDLSPGSATLFSGQIKAQFRTVAGRTALSQLWINAGVCSKDFHYEADPRTVKLDAASLQFQLRILNIDDGGKRMYAAAVSGSLVSTVGTAPNATKYVAKIRALFEAGGPSSRAVFEIVAFGSQVAQATQALPAVDVLFASDMLFGSDIHKKSDADSQPLPDIFPTMSNLVGSSAARAWFELEEIKPGRFWPWKLTQVGCEVILKTPWHILSLPSLDLKMDERGVRLLFTRHPGGQATLSTSLFGTVLLVESGQPQQPTPRALALKGTATYSQTTSDSAMSLVLEATNTLDLLGLIFGTQETDRVELSIPKGSPQDALAKGRAKVTLSLSGSPGGRFSGLRRVEIVAACEDWHLGALLIEELGMVVSIDTASVPGAAAAASKFQRAGKINVALAGKITIGAERMVISLTMDRTDQGTALTAKLTGADGPSAPPAKLNIDSLFQAASGSGWPATQERTTMGWIPGMAGWESGPFSLAELRYWLPSTPPAATWVLSRVTANGNVAVAWDVSKTIKVSSMNFEVEHNFAAAKDPGNVQRQTTPYIQAGPNLRFQRPGLPMSTSDDGFMRGGISLSTIAFEFTAKDECTAQDAIYVVSNGLVNLSLLNLLIPNFKTFRLEISFKGPQKYQYVVTSDSPDSWPMGAVKAPVKTQGWKMMKPKLHFDSTTGATTILGRVALPGTEAEEKEWFPVVVSLPDLSVHLGTDPTSADPTATWPQTGAGQKGGASMLAKILIGLGVTLAVPAVTIILVVTCGLPEVAALDAVGALGVEAGRDLSSLLPEAEKAVEGAVDEIMMETLPKLKTTPIDGRALDSQSLTGSSYTTAGLRNRFSLKTFLGRSSSVIQMAMAAGDGNTPVPKAPKAPPKTALGSFAVTFAADGKSFSAQFTRPNAIDFQVGLVYTRPGTNGSPDTQMLLGDTIDLHNTVIDLELFPETCTFELKRSGPASDQNSYYGIIKLVDPAGQPFATTDTSLLKCWAVADVPPGKWAPRTRDFPLSPAGPGVNRGEFRVTMVENDFSFVGHPVSGGLERSVWRFVTAWAADPTREVANSRSDTQTVLRLEQPFHTNYRFDVAMKHILYSWNSLWAPKSDSEFAIDMLEEDPAAPNQKKIFDPDVQWRTDLPNRIIQVSSRRLASTIWETRPKLFLRLQRFAAAPDEIVSGATAELEIIASWALCSVEGLPYSGPANASGPTIVPIKVFDLMWADLSSPASQFTVTGDANVSLGPLTKHGTSVTKQWLSGSLIVSTPGRHDLKLKYCGNDLPPPFWGAWVVHLQAPGQAGVQLYDNWRGGSTLTASGMSMSQGDSDGNGDVVVTCAAGAGARDGTAQAWAADFPITQNMPGSTIVGHGLEWPSAGRARKPGPVALWEPLQMPFARVRGCLKFEGGRAVWCKIDTRTGAYADETPSDLAARSVNVQWLYGPSALYVLESGRLVLTLARPRVQPDRTGLYLTVSGDAGDGFELKRSQLQVSRGSFDAMAAVPGMLWSDFAFGTNSPLANQTALLSGYPNNRFDVATWPGSLAVAGTNGAEANQWTRFDLKTARVPHVLVYRFRVNMPKVPAAPHLVDETKIELAALVTLRWEKPYQAPRWVWPDDRKGVFVTCADEPAISMGGGYAEVVVAANEGNAAPARKAEVSVYVNGVLRYKQERDSLTLEGGPVTARFGVQHLQPWTDVSVELSHLRILN